MIDFTNINLVSSTPVEPTVTTEEQGKEDVLLDLKGGDTEGDELIDPSSFLMLLAQMIPNISNPDEQTVNTSTENSGIDLTSVSSKPSGVSIDSKTIIDNTLLSDSPTNETNITTETNPQPTEDLNNNIALAWINATSFEPPKIESDAEEIESETAEIETDDLPVLDAIVNNKKASTSDIISTELKQEGTKLQDITESAPIVNEKDSLMQSLQALSTSLTAKQESSDSKINTVVDKLDAVTQEATQTLVHNSPILNHESQNNQQIQTPVSKTLDIPIEINHPKWADQFSEHIVWMGQQNIKSALIKLHPEELGPIEISIKVVKDAASVNIVSHNPEVRNLIGEALPKLRDMMSTQGLNLSEVHVDSHTSSGHSSQQHMNFAEGYGTTAEEEIELTPLVKTTPKGLIDYFA